MARKVFHFCPSAALFGSIIWTFIPTHHTYYTYLGGHGAYIWIPLQIYAIHYLKKYPSRNFLILVISFMDQVLTGRVQAIEASFISLFIMSCFTGIFHRQDTERAVYPYIKARFFKIMMALTLACATLFPFIIEQFQLVTSSNRLGDNPGSHFPPLNWFDVIPWAPPGLFGLSNWTFWVGLSAITFLLISAFKTEEKVRWWSCFVIFALSFGVIYNINIFGLRLFDDLIKSLPFHEGLRYTFRFSPIALIPLLILIMEGVHLLIERPQHTFEKIFVRTNLLFTFVAMITMGLILFDESINWKSKSFYMFLVTSPVFTAAYIYTKRIDQRLISFLSFFLLLQLCFLPFLTHNFQHPLKQFERAHLDDQLISNFPSEIKSNRYRIMVYPSELWSTGMALIRNDYLYLSGYLPLLNKTFVDYIKNSIGGRFSAHRIYDPYYKSPEAYRMASVRYWLVKTTNKTPPFPMLDKTNKIWQSQDKKYEIREDPLAFPRAYFVNELIFDQKRIGDETLNPVIDLSDNKNQLDVRIEAPTDGWLIISDIRDPFHWNLTVNDKEQEDVPVRGTFRAVQVQKGINHIRYVYKIPLDRLLVSFIAILLTAALAFIFKAQEHPHNQKVTLF